ncbi:hypothetical protein BZG36_05385 [Bifiguratus adelaidae]|uniref:Rab-GAP TBC domain-containing protein n=1 Tax=Bifiguratus adelaidae TaxID=1938954 RepID=A0A261XT74_9FUNG|nr:hypothetical protein BZG36_05385 [Bifiguratus adelaidae]
MSEGQSRSFWRRQQARYTGSYNLLSGANNPEQASPPIVIGAQYSYANMLASVAAPSAPTVDIQPSKSLDRKSPSPSPTQSSDRKSPFRFHRHTESSSSIERSISKAEGSPPIKTLSDFLKQTNDEWTDDFEDDWDLGVHVRKHPSKLQQVAATSKDKPPSQVHKRLSMELQEEDGTILEGDIEKRRKGIPSSSPVREELDMGRRKDGLVDDWEAILRDPFAPVKQLQDTLTLHPETIVSTEGNTHLYHLKLRKFLEALSQKSMDLVELRKLSWNGTPQEIRPLVWMLLLDLIPPQPEACVNALQARRQEFARAAEEASNDDKHKKMWHQINIDVPRTQSHLPLFQNEQTQASLKRILFVWALRHPESGYVQGISDLLTPFWVVFLSAYTHHVYTIDPTQLPSSLITVLEADCFWALETLLEGIQDNYIVNQPGIIRQIANLQELIMRIDAPLAQHLEAQNIEYLQFAFRWINCMLMREISLPNTVRMWDTYLGEAEGNGFRDFHVYVCAAFLVKWSEVIQSMEFQDIMLFLQALPTQGWQEKDVALLVSEAFMWQSLFHHAPKHLSRD